MKIESSHLTPVPQRYRNPFQLGALSQRSINSTTKTTICLKGIIILTFHAMKFCQMWCQNDPQGVGSVGYEAVVVIEELQREIVITGRSTCDGA